MVLVIDNYDSFTFNLVQCLGELGAEVEVVRNDILTVQEIKSKAPSHIVISPGPGRPDEAGITEDVIRQCAADFPLLGVCLGHQAMGEVYGGKVIRAPIQMHGKVSEIHHVQSGVFKDLPSPFKATRYHSLVVEQTTFPDDLEVTAWTVDGIVMGLRHKTLKTLQGVQFHPESIMTTEGPRLLRNFLEAAA